MIDDGGGGVENGTMQSVAAELSYGAEAGPPALTEAGRCDGVPRVLPLTDQSSDCGDEEIAVVRLNELQRWVQESLLSGSIRLF